MGETTIFAAQSVVHVPMGEGGWLGERVGRGIKLCLDVTPPFYGVRSVGGFLS